MSARIPIVIGQAPTDADEFWIEALGKETPDQTIARLDKYGQYLFSLTATIATVLTGFSLFKADSLASSRAFWLLLPVAMFAIGLGLASLGLRPRPAEVNRHDSNAIRAYYHALILRRGRYLSAAGIAFALGLFLVPLALALASPRVVGSLGVKLEKSEKAEPGHTVTAKLDLTQVPAGARARLAVMAGAEPVAVQSGGPDPAGKVAFQVTAKGAGPHRVEGVVEAGGEVLFRQETSVP
jgi:hypothetical protein